MKAENPRNKPVVIVGMGYVGLTLASVLVSKGHLVHGYDVSHRTVELLNQGHSPVYEPGVEGILKEHLGENLHLSTSFPKNFKGTVIICVSTPVNMRSHIPDLSNLYAAMDTVKHNIESGCLIIVRSTVPVGTTRLVAESTRQDIPETLVAFCPERTIQGKALHELTHLPQVIGGMDTESSDAAKKLFATTTEKTITVSCPEVAELVKLTNNCHTDVIYSYGNEIALIAEELGLDAWEVIQAANEDYPRPNIARPGFVGGSCLSKDPYLLLHSLTSNGVKHYPQLIASARELNEALPVQAARRFLETLLEVKKGNIRDSKILICGFAYKGVPATDDMRGSAATPIVEFLRRYPLRLYGHDPVVQAEAIEPLGVTVTSIADGFEQADGVMFLNDHTEYREIPLQELIHTMRTPAVVYDSWRILDRQIDSNQPNIHYMGVGYG